MWKLWGLHVKVVEIAHEMLLWAIFYMIEEQIGLSTDEEAEVPGP